MKKTIVFASCRAKPDLQNSDVPLAKAFEARGYAVAAAPWNGPQVPFADAAAVLIRSTWDYQDAPEDFSAWLAALPEGRVFNDPALMRPNMSKRYLLDLARRGAPLPPTLYVEADAGAIAAAMDALELETAVVKPEYGATASGLSLVRREDQEGLAAAAAKMAMPGLVQAPVAEISTAGETSFVFIAGGFTHAVTKRPKAGEIRCQADYGGAAEPAEPPDWAVKEAARVLAMIQGEPLYARVDAVLLDGEMRLMEVELIEPELFFTYSPVAAARLADALFQRLK